MKLRNKKIDAGNGNNYQENPPARRDKKKEETIEVFLKDFAEIANLPEEHVYDFGEYFYLRGWRRNDVEEKYNLRFMLWVDAAAIVLFIASILLLVKEFLPFFGVVI